MNIFKKGEQATRTVKLYSVYDSVAEVWGKPFPMKNKGEAIRGFTQAVNDQSTQLYLHPEDYTLFEIGEWDDDTGTIIMHPAKISCGVAIEYKSSPQNYNEATPDISRMESPQKLMEIAKETQKETGDKPNVQ